MYVKNPKDQDTNALISIESELAVIQSTCFCAE